MFRKLSEVDFTLWGKEASQQYVDSKLPMDDTIVKIAMDNHLEHEHVKRIVEEANTQTYLRKFAEDGDKYVVFDMADTSKIMTKLSEQKTPKPHKAGKDTDDYNRSPKEHLKEKMGSTDGCADSSPGGWEPSELEKTSIVFTIEKIGHDFQDDIEKLSHDYTRIYNALVELYKQSALNEDEEPPKVISQAVHAFVDEKYGANSEEAKIASQIVGDIEAELATNPAIKMGAKLAYLPPINETDPIFMKMANLIDNVRTYTTYYNDGPRFERLEPYLSEKNAEFASKAQDALIASLAAAGIIGGATITAHKIGYDKGKRVQEVMMSPTRSLPDSHNPNR